VPILILIWFFNKNFSTEELAALALIMDEEHLKKGKSRERLHLYEELVDDETKFF
jgi:hypothetical protein